MFVILIEFARLIAMVSGFGFSLFFLYMNVKGDLHDYPGWSNEKIIRRVYKDTVISFIPFIVALVLAK